ncbi:hypothetical protein Pmani_023661 [Petrolisthes manimaculis]|uniref:Major facilitator superfamily associated domain-containing protein n=1 Tax=Petrolisthes manimaculis TaxID=1843537 RepID=A0AAE1PBK2_9EUCA|nr:hypothetical protein Pmani_023661 [Petrolisthes manimaculis]
MKINWKLIPIKIHYFCFLGCISPIIPFLLVLGMQMGIPVEVSSGLHAVFLLSVVLVKPIFAMTADAFPSYRRLIFILTLVLMTLSHCSIYFIPPLRENLGVEGQLVWAVEKGTTKPVSVEPGPPYDVEGTHEDNHRGELVLRTQYNGSCFVAKAWDCVARCNQPWACINNNSYQHSIFHNTFKITALGNDHGLDVVQSGEMGSGGGLASPGGIEHSGQPVWGVEGQRHKRNGHITNDRFYRIEGVNVSTDLLMTNLSVECDGGEWEGEDCNSVWMYGEFWGFAVLLLVGTIAMATGVSVTDAIIVDTIGKDGDYGVQRAWGTVGWGLMGPVSGLLIDWWSGSSVTKDYAPAFLICFILGSVDVLVAATSIRVPKIETETNLISKVRPLLKQPRFFVFCIFVILNGAFDVFSASYVIVMQEDMARGTSAMNYIKFIQGLTIFVECGIEAPFMFINKWFMTRLGAHYVTSLVFFLYIFRLLGLCLAGWFCPVWVTLVVEMLNGPCYGLGYTAIVVYSSRISPPGTSTTVQSITNICYESIGYSIAMFGGGQLYGALGGPMMYLVVGIAAIVVFVLHIISLRLLPPPPEENTKIIQEQSSKEEEGAGTEKIHMNAEHQNTDKETPTENEEERLNQKRENESEHGTENHTEKVV